MVVLLLTGLLAQPALARSEGCTGEEMTGVFVFDGIYGPLELELTRLSVIPLGVVTWPTEEQMIRAIEAVQPGGYYRLHSTTEPWNYFWNPPGDFGGMALVDGRTGVVPFAGTVVWMGTGDVTVPAASTNDWSFVPGDPAGSPASVEILDCGCWIDDWGTADDITADCLDLLRTTDVLHSFAACGSYRVTGTIYTPSVGLTDPSVAKCVILVSGTVGPPWNGGAAVVRGAAWGEIKALYR